LRLVDAEGLGALSMRRLGAEPGGKAMSLYQPPEGSASRSPKVFPLLAQIGLDNPAAYPPTEAVLARFGPAGFEHQLRRPAGASRIVEAGASHAFSDLSGTCVQRSGGS
jgi:hypothetical protein